MVLSQKRVNTPVNSTLKAWLSTTDSQKHPGKENHIQQDSDLRRAIELSLQESQKEKRQGQPRIIMSDDDDNDFQPFPRVKRLRVPKNKQRRRTQTENNGGSQLPLSSDFEANNDNRGKGNQLQREQQQQQQPANPVKIKKERRLEEEEEHVIHFDDLYDDEDFNIKQENDRIKIKQEVHGVEEEEEEFVVEFDDFNESPIIKQEDEVTKSKVSTSDIDATTIDAQATTITTTGTKAQSSNDTQDTEVADLTDWTSFNSREIFTPSPPIRPSDEALVSAPFLFLDKTLSSSSSYATVAESSSPFHTTNIAASNRDKGKRPARAVEKSSTLSSSLPALSTLDTLNIPKRRKQEEECLPSPVFLQQNDTDDNIFTVLLSGNVNSSDKEHQCPLCNKLFSFEMIEAHASDCMAESADVPAAGPSNSLWSSSREIDNATQEPSFSIIDQQQRPAGILPRERRQKRLNRLASQRQRRIPTPTPIADETYSDIEEYSDDNGTDELKTCLICGATIPAQHLEKHIDEELNAMEQKGQQLQDRQSSAEPRSSSSMTDLRDSFRDNVMVLSDGEDSESDSDGVVDLSGPGPIPFDRDNGSNHNNDDDEDDYGYLSPLEGFESINPQDHPQYYNQGTRQTSRSSSRQRRTPGTFSSSTPKRRRGPPRQGRGSRRTPAQNRAIHAKRAQRRGQSKGGGGSKKPKAPKKSKGKK